MSSLAAGLADLLSTVRRPGDFFTSGTAEIHAPRLEVDGVGPIALPLLPIQAEQLIAVAEPAPFGRGQDTMVDPAVRRTWQISADRVRIEGRHWARTLSSLLTRVGDGLGVAAPIEAELYKLLVYDQGSFFVSHRDTEKAPAMFATLVVVLPSISAGGELVVRHKGREVCLDLRCDDPSEAAFAAFYADCVHEVLPVTAGCRLTLVYNLLRRGRGPAPEPPAYADQQTQAAALLKAWSADEALDDGLDHDAVPDKLIYPLEHAYTPAELGFGHLKGADAAAAGVLLAAAPGASCDLHLALISVEESGIAEHTGGGWGRHRDEQEFEVVEVDDRSVTLSEWRRPDGNPTALGAMWVEADELSPPDALDDLDPDEEHFHEATGNEGASFERTYSRAALVLWPRERLMAMLGRAGPSVALPYLADLSERWAAAGEDDRSALRDQARDLAGHILAAWPVSGWHAGQDDKPGEATELLRALARLEDLGGIEAFLSAVIARARFGASDNPAILAALALLPPERGVAAVAQIIAGAAGTARDACAELLARFAAALPEDRRLGLRGAAAALVEALPGDPARPAPLDPWGRSTPVTPGFVVDLLTALDRVDTALGERAVAHALAWPRAYDPDAVLVPALRGLVGSETADGSAAVQHLRAVCIGHLRARAAEPLHPPKDWRRASAVGCRCAHCAELSRFLADPTRELWVFKAAETHRGHVEATIRQAGCDLDAVTDRRGRPYSLVCRKNLASYESRVAQRKQDLVDLDRLAT